MKKNHTPFAMLAVVLVAAFLLFGCEGPAGAPGKDGQNGSNTVLNLEGFAPNAQCGTCHTPGQDTLYNVAGRTYQWEVSRHATGGTIERNGPDCAGCHTTEGFIKRMNGHSNELEILCVIIYDRIFDCHFARLERIFAVLGEVMND